MKITNDNYYSDTTHLTNSMLGYIKESPLHLEFYLKGKLTKSTDSLSFGNYYDEYLLEPDVFADKYAIMPAGMRRGTKAYKEWLQDNKDKESIRYNDFLTIKNMADSLQNYHDIYEMLRIGEKQKILQWEYKGVKCKGKLDNYIPGEAIVDLKTAKEGSISYWKHAVRYLYDYDRQAAWYQFGEGHQLDFFWVVQEKKEPYIPMLVKATSETLMEGYEKYKKLFDLYKSTFIDNKFNFKDYVNYYEV